MVILIYYALTYTIISLCFRPLLLYYLQTTYVKNLSDSSLWTGS